MFTDEFMNRSVAVAGLLAAMLLVLPAALLAQTPAASNPLKVYISADMEGVAGAVTTEQLDSEGFEYERFRQFMTNETLAAVRAAIEAGAQDIVVSDSHGNGQNLLIEQFPAGVRIVRSWPRHGGMAGQLDASFDAVLLIGYHTSSASAQGVRAHTFSSSNFTGIALNGRQVSEGALVAAYAGARGVPVVFVSGDDATVAELRAEIGNVQGVETKRALSFHSALTLTPAQAVEQIHAGVRTALGRLREFKPFVLTKPITLDLSYKNQTPAEMMSYLRAVQRVDPRTIRFIGRDIDEVTDFIEFAAGYSSELSP